jgi:hypothetical protein
LFASVNDAFTVPGLGAAVSQTVRSRVFVNIC